MQTTEEQIALERFHQGEEVEALAELDRLRATQARSVTNLALTAFGRGKITLADVIERYEEVVRLDPHGVGDRVQLERLRSIADSKIALVPFVPFVPFVPDEFGICAPSGGTGTTIKSNRTERDWLLKIAAEVDADPTCWIKEGGACNALGVEVDPRTSDATCWSVKGFMERDNNNYWTALTRAQREHGPHFQAYNEFLGGPAQFVQWCRDAAELCSQAMSLSVLEKAIAIDQAPESQNYRPHESS